MDENKQDLIDGLEAEKAENEGFASDEEVDKFLGELGNAS